jgi:hypothetical protein
VNRRTLLTNPISEVWQTAYPAVATGGIRETLLDPNSVTTQRDFDRLGCLVSIAYGDPSVTPDVKFSYDAAGNRTNLSEYSLFAGLHQRAFLTLLPSLICQ